VDYLAAGDSCIPLQIASQYPPSARMRYENVESGGLLQQQASVSQSDTFKYLYQKAAYNCEQNKIIKQC
jgi:hypothetical protein